jgi:hypothetical protein
MTIKQHTHHQQHYRTHLLVVVLYLLKGTLLTNIYLNSTDWWIGVLFLYVAVLAASENPDGEFLSNWLKKGLALRCFDSLNLLAHLVLNGQPKAKKETKDTANILTIPADHQYIML